MVSSHTDVTVVKGWSLLKSRRFPGQNKTPRPWSARIPMWQLFKRLGGDGSGTPTEPHHTPSTEAQQTSSTTHSSPTLLPVTTAPIPTVTSSDTSPLKQYTRRTRIAQSSVLSSVADEPVSPLGDGSQGEACLTDSGFEADQDRVNIAKTSTLPHDSAPRVTSPAADEGSMQQKLDELMALCTSLQRQHSEMVPKFEAHELEINRRRLDVVEEAAERVSDDTEEMETILTSMDAATVLSSGVAEIPTGSGSIPTAGPHAAEVPTGSDVVPTAESETPKKKKIQEKMDIQMARQLEEEMEREAQRLRIELISDLVRYQDNYAKEEVERFKRKGIRFEQESVKKLKTSEEVKATEEVPKDKVKEMMHLVPLEEIYVEALQVKHIIIDWKVHTEGQRNYWKIIRLGGSSASYQFFVNLLKHLDREDLNQLWALVKESLNIRPALRDKEMELWVELKSLYEPDVEDQLWNHTQNMMHALVEWKLYDSCGVHHVTSKDNEVFMLIEKDYPLRKGLAILMISYKLQVENYSQMANDLILKIYKIANYPSQKDD
nr:hypothetical protein [Tanacetum cinerariifolium]